MSGNEGHVQLWDVSGRPHLTHVLHGMGSINKYREAVTALAYSPDGSLVAAGDVNHTAGPVPWRYGTVAVWNVATGRLLWKVRNKDGWVNDIAFSPDGTMLAAGQETNRVTLYDPQTGRVLRTVDPEGLTGYVCRRLQPERLARDGRLVRDRPALESLLGARSGQADAGRSRSCRQHHVQPERLDVRDDRRLGRPCEALDDCNAATGRERAGGSERNLEPRGLHPRRRPSGRRLRRRDGECVADLGAAPGSGAHAPSPAGT